MLTEAAGTLQLFLPCVRCSRFVKFSLAHTVSKLSQFDAQGCRVTLFSPSLPSTTRFGLRAGHGACAGSPQSGSCSGRRHLLPRSTTNRGHHRFLPRQRTGLRTPRLQTQTESPIVNARTKNISIDPELVKWNARVRLRSSWLPTRVAIGKTSPQFNPFPSHQQKNVSLEPEPV